MAGKVIIHMSRSEVPLVEQDIVDYVYTAYFDPKKKEKYYFAFENMKKMLIIGPNFLF